MQSPGFELLFGAMRQPARKRRTHYYLVEQFGRMIDQKLEPLKKDMATKSDLQEVKQSQAQTNTALEALAAGQKRTGNESIHSPLRAESR